MIQNIKKIKHILKFANDSRSLKAKKNIFLLLFLNGFNFLSIIILVPLTIDYLGTIEYGIWVTLHSLIMWLIHLDFGIGNGLRNRLTESIANKDFDKAKSYVSSSYIIFGIGIFSFWLIFGAIYKLVNWEKIFNAPSYLKSNLENIVFIVISFYSLSFLLKLINSIINADQRPALNGLLSAITNILTVVVIFVLFKTTEGNLLYLGIVYSIIPLLVFLIASIILFRTLFKKISPSLKSVNLSYAKDLSSYGIKFFIIQISVLILASTDNIIITQLFGPAEVTVYNVAFKYFYFLPLIFNVIALPFWSATTDAYVKNDFEWIKKSISKLSKIWFAFLFITLLMLLVANTIYKIWVGENINIPFSLSLFMGIFVIITNWNILFTSFLNGIGKIQLQLYLSVFVGIINIPLSILLAKYFNMGISGIITATCICILITALWAPIQVKKLVEGNAKGIWNK